MVRAALRPDVSEDLDPVRAQRRKNLQPFSADDPERAAAAGRKGGEVRRARKTANVTDARAVARSLAVVRTSFDRDRLGADAAAVAGWVLGQITSGRVPIRNGDEAATLLRALVDVARIEEGQSTSTTLVAHIGAGATAEILQLRDQARRALGMGDVVDVVTGDASTALAVDDSAT